MADRLTPTFVQTLLADAQAGLAVDVVLVKPGSGRGDNYTAMLYRVQVQGSVPSDDPAEESDRLPWKQSLIYKCLPTSTERRQAYRSDVLFSNEVAFYTRAYPALLAFQHSRGVFPGFRAVPRCYTARPDLLLLEDLGARGFIMLDRKAGLNEEQCSAVLRELAQFHALSLAMRAQRPSLFHEHVTSSIREALFVPENEAWYREYYAAACNSALDSVRASLPEKYSQRLEKFTSGFFDRMTQLVSGRDVDIVGTSTSHADISINGGEASPEAEDLERPLVLCHGDAWNNNIMFRLDHGTGEVLEVVMLDFQLARVGSPALDLANLLYCCTTRTMRDHHLEDWLLLYHDHLSHALYALGSVDAQELTYEDLRYEMRKYAPFGLGLAMDIIPMSTCESTEAPDLYMGGSAPGVGGQLQEGCGLLQGAPTEEGRKRMAELVQEMVDMNFI